MERIAYEGQTVELGRLGENEAIVIKFLVSPILYEFPDARFVLLNKRPTDPAAYPVASVILKGNYLEWTVSSGDVRYEGEGKCEIVAYSWDAIAKTVIYDTVILPALDGSGTPPEPWESWVNQVSDDADRAEAAAELLEHPGAEATTLPEGSEATAGYSEGTFSFGIPKGDTGNGIANTVLNADYTLTVNYTNGDHDTTGSIRGEKGEPGDVGLSLFDVNGDMELVMSWNSGSDVPDFAINDNMELEVII